MDKTVIELFAGVGGFRCGLNRVKLKGDKVTENGNRNFVRANQWEPATKTQEAFDCYIKRFGDKHASNVDIFEVTKNNMKSIPKHTLLVGGFPCQDYSVAQTLKSSKGIQGKKGVLWRAILDIVKAKHPPFLFLENVDRLLLSPANQRGRDFGIILRTLLDEGYAVQWRVINAGEYGFPQKRRRTYIVAYHKSTKYFKKLQFEDPHNIVFENGIFSKAFPVEANCVDYNLANISKKIYPDILSFSDKFETQFFNAGVMCDGKVYTIRTNPKCNKLCTLRDIRETGEVDYKYFLNENQLEQFKKAKGGKRKERISPNGDSYFYAEGSMPFPDNLDAPARTMVTSESSIGRMSHVIEDAKTGKFRTLTPIEAERINMFPDNWTNSGMTDKKRFFMMGNALVVGVVGKIGEKLEEIIDEE